MADPKERDCSHEVEYEPVDPELLKYVEKRSEETTLERYGVYDDHDDKVRAEKKKKHEKEGFHDTVTFQNQLFHVDEVHQKDEIVGNFCVVMVPDRQKDKMLTFSFRTDPKRIARPVIFHSQKDCAYYLRICYANPKIARIIQLTDEMFVTNDFQKTGAFLMRPSEIILPRDLHKRSLNNPIY